MTIPMFPGTPANDRAPNLRPYQKRGIELLRMHIRQGHSRILAVLPTGGGKMYMTAAMTRTATVPTLFVAHRMELIDQCVNELARLGITNVGVIRGNDDRFDPGAATQIASIQTLARRDKPPAGLIFVDEAHRAASDSYIDHVFHAYPDAQIIGWTATPTRLDGRPLGGDLFQALEVVCTYQELLKHPDWLVAPDVYSTAPIDLSLVKMSYGDFDEKQLGAVMHSDRLEGQIVDHWMKLAHRHPVFSGSSRVPFKFTDGPRRRTLVFAVNIEHSRAIANRFAAAGVRVAHIDGTTPEAERRTALKSLGAGELEVICNCNVLLEGVDVPEIKCIVHARPTQSMVLWRQSIGRCMRPALGQVPLLLDHAGNFDRLGSPVEDLIWTLSDRPMRRSNAPQTKLCKRCYAYVVASALVCPYCGYEFKPEDNPQTLPSETNAELALRQSEPDAAKRAFYVRQVIAAKSRGFKPGYASAMYKERYGMWPDRAWSDETRGEFATDAEWQAKLASREKRRKAEEAPPATELEAELGNTLSAMDAEDESFADWWNRQ